jgi:hypothetical protein
VEPILKLEVILSILRESKQVSNVKYSHEKKNKKAKISLTDLILVTLK